MEYLTRSDLKKLSSLCVERQLDDYRILEDPNASNADKAFAEHDRCWMKSLQAKLDRIDASKARRIEVTL
ncbi:MAG: hypothetical protein II008_00430 [Oscillospiraceae bacterium]|nr:hypothetical protein [Oscillospiraceae bacterium]